MATAPQRLEEERQQPPAPKRDFRQEVTDNLVQMLEKGAAPWQKPWEKTAAPIGMPTNPTTGKAYRGGNTVHLMATAVQRQFDDPRWMTYKQAAENGWQVRKGEKGTQIEFWEVRDNRGKAGLGGAKEESSGNNIQPDDERRLIHRIYTVFNAKQIDGIPSLAQQERPSFEVVQSGERILQNSGARIVHDQADRAYYSRSEDRIHLPPKAAFKEAAGYYGTALHELSHWTGHPTRLDRKTLAESYRFGDTNYAKEELRAEIASLFLAAERGIPHDPQQHAAYVGHWIKALKEDKNEIFRAAQDASKAADFLIDLDRDRSIAEEELDKGDVTTAPELEEQAGRLERDTEDAPELNSEVRGENVQETCQFTQRPERDSGTVKLHDKQAGIESTAVVATDRKSNTAKHDLQAEQAVTSNALGSEAKTYAAQVESGTYRGPIVGETTDCLVQRVSGRSAVAHLKDALDKQPSTGDHVTIHYSNGRASVRELQERVREHALAR